MNTSFLIDVVRKMTWLIPDLSICWDPAFVRSNEGLFFFILELPFKGGGNFFPSWSRTFSLCWKKIAAKNSNSKTNLMMREQWNFNHSTHIGCYFLSTMIIVTANFALKAFKVHTLAIKGNTDLGTPPGIHHLRDNESKSKPLCGAFCVYT